MAKIAIDAGHGLYTDGKRCLKSLDKSETREWVLNDRVADYLMEYLKGAGHTVMRVDDTDGSTDVSLANRCKKANEWGADFYCSVHHNAGVYGGSGGGLVVYVAPNCSSKSVKAQVAIYNHSIARANLKGNRYDGTLSANFYVIKHTNMPAVLIECGFMDSRVDIKYILDPKWSKKMALGIAEGICEVFGGTVKESTSQSTSTSTGSSTASSSKKLYRVQLGAFGKKSNAEAVLEKADDAGFDDAFIKTSESDKLYRVQVGAYSLKGNAETMLQKVKSAGFKDAFIKES